ncbi:hypothetical protein [Streptomyces sp. NBC_00038]|uniref:hypothetical protein n=1 Tax=Streptomyces sp. NBC_00038 TaxID=2903615 RepID=UPI00225C1597|nr:hypothetical protein [Streptomyces sp. NBC_00038]MCX5558484.1 hypothetical protein [Streptomyces sp. NBC_00038]
MAEPTAREEERLRAALALIGDAAAGPDPAAATAGPTGLDPVRPPAPHASSSPVRSSASPPPVRPPGRASLPRRRLALVGGALAAAVLCAAALLTNDTWFRDTQSGATRTTGPAEDEGSVGQTYAEGIACARLIVEGDVLDVRQAPQAGRVLLTFAVDDWIKPGQGESTVELDLVDPTVAAVEEPFSKGQHLLLVVPVREDLEADASSGTELTRMRKIIDSNWAEAAKTECPPYWKGTQS